MSENNNKHIKIYATKDYVDDAIMNNSGISDYNDLENKPCYGDIPTAGIIIEKTITDFSYENRDVVEIGTLYAGWNNDLETRVFVNIYQDFNEDDMQGLLNNGVFIDSSYYDEIREVPFVIDPEGYGNVYLYDNGCYFYTPYSSTIDFILVTEDNYIFGDGTPLSRGIWLNYVYYGGMERIDEFSKPDGAYITFKYTTKSVNNDSFKQLDEKYIPDSIKDYNNLSNVPCIDSRDIKLEKFDLESICNKGIGDSIAEELAAYEQIEIAEGVKIFKISNEPLFTYDDFLYAHLHRIDFDDNYVITERTINNITFKYDLDYLSSDYIDDECYDYNKFLFIQDGLLIVIEDNTSILLKTGNTITLSKGSYGVIENTVVLNNVTKAVWCEIAFCHYVGEFKELDEKFIRSHLDGIYGSMVGTYHIRNNEKLGESFNSYGESYNRATGQYSHTEGFNTKALSFAQHVQGKYNIDDDENIYAHIVGNGTDYNNRSNAHTLDWNGNAWFKGNVSIDGTPTNDKDLVTKKYVDDAIQEINFIDLTVENSLTVGNRLEDSTIGQYSVTQGLDCEASGEQSCASGYYTRATGQGAHAEGFGTIASGSFSHAEGDAGDPGETVASGYASHAEGCATKATGEYSHTEGFLTEASGQAAHAEGYNTKASGEYQHVIGQNNIEDNENKYAYIVGNGTFSTPSNAHTLDWNGNAWFQGNVSIDGAPTNDNDLTTKKYVDDNLEDKASTEYVNNMLSGLRLVQMTKAEYEALTEKDPSVLYIIVN